LDIPLAAAGPFAVAYTVGNTKQKKTNTIPVFVSCSGYRSNNFIVGLTNTHPSVQAPVLWNYTLCGQYPGAVPDGATVSVQCTHAYNRGLRFRHVIVQFPLTNDWMNFCEIEVFVVGKTVISWKIVQKVMQS